MLIKSISFPTYLEDIMDIENSNIDVFVESEDGKYYPVEKLTVSNITEGFVIYEKLTLFDN